MPPPPSLAGVVAMVVRMRGAVAVGVRLDQDVGRHQHDAAVAHAALGDHVLGEMLHLLGLAAQDRHLHAAVMVEMRMHRGERQLVVVVEGVGEALGNCRASWS